MFECFLYIEFDLLGNSTYCKHTKRQNNEKLKSVQYCVGGVFSLVLSSLPRTSWDNRAMCPTYFCVISNIAWHHLV